MRRIAVELDRPTRDGDRAIQILTNLPGSAAEAIRAGEMYRGRWTLETAFQELESSPNGEISTLGYLSDRHAASSIGATSEVRPEIVARPMGGRYRGVNRAIR